MTVRSNANACTLVLAVFGGAVLGALAMALTTPKTGREVRSTLRDSMRRLGRMEEPAVWDEEAMFI